MQRHSADLARTAGSQYKKASFLTFGHHHGERAGGASVAHQADEHQRLSSIQISKPDQGASRHHGALGCADLAGSIGSVKGIYLTTDSATGKLYVGKAGGEDDIWDAGNPTPRPFTEVNVALRRDSELTPRQLPSMTCVFPSLKSRI